MDRFRPWLDSILELFSASNLQMLLLIGSGILAMSLLVLAMTRWGQSRPVWKCVILSFAAHILLIGYAYGTRLIFETPAVVTPSTPMRVNLIEEVGESVQEQLPVETTRPEPPKWDRFTSQAPPTPELTELERPDVDSQLVIEQPEIEVSEPVAPEIQPQDLSVNSSLPTLDVPLQETSIPTSEELLPRRPNELDVAQQTVEPQEIEIPTPQANPTPVAAEPKFEIPEEIVRQKIDQQDSPAQNNTQPPTVSSGEPSQETDSKPIINELLDSAAKTRKTEQLPTAPQFQSQVKNTAPLRAIPRATPRNNARPLRIADGSPLPKIYSLRQSESRLAAAQRRGGSIATERAVELALAWLASRQAPNGSWDPIATGAGTENRVFGHDRHGAGAQAQTGLTGLAALTFLAAGQSHLEGQYQTEVRRALEFLIQQQKSNGDLSGEARLFARMYCHSMALLALSESLAMTGDHRLKPAVERGVRYSIAAQNARSGGWRYQPGDSGDMSQFGWQVLALHSAKEGGISIPQSANDLMVRFLDSCATGAAKGLASYRPNQGPSTTMTAEALLCRYFLHQPVSTAMKKEATDRIVSELPNPRYLNLYYWYYGTLAMYHTGGESWDRWNRQLKQQLLSSQNRQGRDKGSWPANGVWGGYGGQVYSTAMATLSLEVYYRYLPMYQQEIAGRETNDRR